jgi:hypothetical protein
VVTRKPEKNRSPLWNSRTLQVWPTLLLSTSNCTSILPFSGLSLSFHVDGPLHDPCLMTSPPPASAVVAGTSSPRATAPDKANRAIRVIFALLSEFDFGVRWRRRDDLWNYGWGDTVDCRAPISRSS